MVSLLPGHVGADGPELKQHFSVARSLPWPPEVRSPSLLTGEGTGQRADEAPGAGGRCECKGPKEEAAGTTHSWERGSWRSSNIRKSSNRAAWGGGSRSTRQRKRELPSNILDLKRSLKARRARVDFQCLCEVAGPLDGHIPFPTHFRRLSFLLLPHVHPLHRGTQQSEPFPLSVWAYHLTSCCEFPCCSLSYYNIIQSPCQSPGSLGELHLGFLVSPSFLPLFTSLGRFQSQWPPFPSMKMSNLFCPETFTFSRSLYLEKASLTCLCGSVIFFKSLLLCTLSDFAEYLTWNTNLFHSPLLSSMHLPALHCTFICSSVNLPIPLKCIKRPISMLCLPAQCWNSTETPQAISVCCRMNELQMSIDGSESLFL